MNQEWTMEIHERPIGPSIRSLLTAGDRAKRNCLKLSPSSGFGQKPTDCGSEELNSTRVPELLVWFLVLLRPLLSVRIRAS